MMAASRTYGLALLNLGVGVLYALSGALGLWLGGLVEGNVTLLWPPTGIALAAVTLYGFRVWPGLAVGALVATLSTGAPWGFALFTALGNPLPAIITLAVIRRWRDSRNWKPNDVWDAVLLVGIGAAVTPVVSAAIGVLGLWANGMVPVPALPAVFRSWYAGDAVGAALIGPFLIALMRESPLAALRQRPWESVAINLAALGFCLLVVVEGVSRSQILVIVAFPLIIWSALRFSPLVTTGLALLIDGFALGALIEGLRASAASAAGLPILEVQMFAATLSATGLVLAMAVSDRNRVHLALSNAYADLQRMAEVTAHHLQEPVRLQHAFSERLLQLVPESLDDDARQCLRFIIDGARRQRALIRDVQLYLAIPDERQAALACSPREALEAALGREPGGLTRAAVRMPPDDPPRIRISCARLTELFFILLENAADYRHPDRPPVVSISATARSGWVEFVVADNGIGIEAAYRERVFRAFERLSSHGDSEKTGIGLALARKIVERAGGRIWIEDAEDGGAAIHFTLREENKNHG